MGPRIGLIAGSGDFPLFVLHEAKTKGLWCAVLAVQAGTPAALESQADAWCRIDAGRPAEAFAFLRKHEVRDIIFAGKIDPSVVFGAGGLEAMSRRLIEDLPDKRPSALVQRVFDLFTAQGFRIMDPEPFLKPFFCEEGDLTPTAPSREAGDDIAFGWPIARAIADLDIGQTLVVKDKMIVAVEGWEGTDEAIRRGGRLAGPGTVVLKVGRTAQPLRVDLPGVGLATVRSLIEAGASALCLEAGRVAFFQQAEAVALAGSRGLALTARRG